MSEVADRPRTDRSADAARLLAVVAQLLRESEPQARERPVRLDSRLERDLGIDSLAKVELIVRIERAFDARLPERLLGTAETPRDLLRAVQAGGARALQPGAPPVSPIAHPGCRFWCRASRTFLAGPSWSSPTIPATSTPFSCLPRCRTA